jgi:hypothetical protein
MCCSTGAHKDHLSGQQLGLVPAGVLCLMLLVCWCLMLLV